MTAGVVYAAVIAALLGAAGWGIERVLRGLGRPARGVWAGSLVLSWVIPAAVLLRPARTGSGAGVESGAGLPAGLLEVTASPAGAPTLLASLPDLTPWVVGLWLGSAALALAVFAVGLVGVTRRSRRWPVERVGGVEVRVSPDFGPALVGLLRPEVVLPGWTRELDADTRALVVLHESEHRRAGDPWLLLGGTLLTLLAPWSPALWWQLRRLRLAVEVDCDHRVLRHGVSRRRYGSLLLDVGERRGRRPGLVPAPAMAEPPSLLERRLTMLTTTRGGPWTWAGAVTVVGLAVLAACETPRPDPMAPTEDEAAEAPATATFQAREVPSSPLIVVEGVEKPGTGLAELGIQPQDIDRIEVVKGEAARERFGERGENGVIHIFLKEEGGDGAEAGSAGTVRELADILGAVERRARDAAATGTDPGTAPDAPSSAVYRLRELPSAGPTGTVRVRGGSIRYDSKEGRGRMILEGAVSGLENIPGQPVVFVDGVRVDESVGELGLTPDRIERVEVVKGEAAGALLGDEAAGGVIRITTKR